MVFVRGMFIGKVTISGHPASCKPYIRHFRDCVQSACAGMLL